MTQQLKRLRWIVVIPLVLCSMIGAKPSKAHAFIPAVIKTVTMLKQAPVIGNLVEKLEFEIIAEGQLMLEKLNVVDLSWCDRYPIICSTSPYLDSAMRITGQARLIYSVNKLHNAIAGLKTALLAGQGIMIASMAAKAIMIKKQIEAVKQEVERARIENYTLIRELSQQINRSTRVIMSQLNELTKLEYDKLSAKLQQVYECSQKLSLESFPSSVSHCVNNIEEIRNLLSQIGASQREVFALYELELRIVNTFYSTNLHAYSSLRELISRTPTDRDLKTAVWQKFCSVWAKDSGVRHFAEIKENFTNCTAATAWLPQAIFHGLHQYEAKSKQLSDYVLQSSESKRSASNIKKTLLQELSSYLPIEDETTLPSSVNASQWHANRLIDLIKNDAEKSVVNTLNFTLFINFQGSEEFKHYLSSDVADMMYTLSGQDDLINRSDDGQWILNIDELKKTESGYYAIRFRKRIPQNLTVHFQKQTLLLGGKKQNCTLAFEAIFHKLLMKTSFNLTKKTCGTDEKVIINYYAETSYHQEVK